MKRVLTWISIFIALIAVHWALEQSEAFDSLGWWYTLYSAGRSTLEAIGLYAIYQFSRGKA